MIHPKFRVVVKVITGRAKSQAEIGRGKMGQWVTVFGVTASVVGIARAAYEHALAYAHKRKQGGVAIIQHQNVRSRLFHMFRKVELSPAMVIRAMEYNLHASRPAL